MTAFASVLAAADLPAAAAKALVCGAVVWMLVRSVDHAPAAVTALVIGLPMILAPGYLAMADTTSDAFLAEAGLRGAQAMLALLVFMVLAGRFFGRLGLIPLLTLGLGGWVATIWLVTLSAEPWPLWLSLAAGAAGILGSHLVLPIRPGLPVSGAGAAAGRRRPAWPVAVQATATMLVLSVFAKFFGPTLSAILAGVPVAMIFVTIGMARAGSRNAAATYQSARLGLPCLYMYLAALVLFIPYTGGTAAALLAVLPSVALSALIVAGRLKLTIRETSP